MVMLGIDPGLNGAMALMDGQGEIIKMWDMPTLDRAHGKGREINGYLLADMVREAQEIANKKIEAMMELVGPMPRDSRPAAFKFGDTFGVIRGVLAARYVKLHYTRPAEWKRYHGLLKKDKEASRSLAIQKWPEHRDLFKRVKDSDRAEAVLIGEFGLTRFGWGVED